MHDGFATDGHFPPAPSTLLRPPAADPPRLLVVIDTEEEFDWDAPPRRDATSVRAMTRAHLVQEIFESYGIVPCWAVDWPIATQPESAGPLREWVKSGHAEVGAHLHPWVNPPFDEELSRRNMYPGNLTPALERAKLSRLTDCLGEVFGSRPRIYKAGRYGLGPSSAGILEELRYEVDVSVCPTLDSSRDGGPNWSSSECEPYLFGPSGTLLEIPATAAFVGALGRAGGSAYRRASIGMLEPLRLPAVLARTGLVERLMLSPEGFKPAHHRRLVRTLLARGVRLFTWSFHSSSVLPGATPYVRSEADLPRFLDAFRSFFDWFLGELGGRATTVSEMRARLTSGHGTDTRGTGSRPPVPRPA